MLTLNSTAISLKGLRITASQELAAKDASGQTSSTDSAETGAKAKMLSVTGMLPFSMADHLSEIYSMAEAVEAAPAKSTVSATAPHLLLASNKCALPAKLRR